MKDELGDRMKEYESVQTSLKGMSTLPIIARLDGKAFHTFTKGLDRPYDAKFHALMVETTKFLVEKSGAAVGYTQSDEITLVFYQLTHKSKIFYDGKFFKLNSILASWASVFFNKHLSEFLPNKAHLMPVFDCRTFNVPNTTEAYNLLLWRQKDATRNSILSAGYSVYSHKQLHGKSTDEVQEMLFQKGINWNDYPAEFKRGTFVLKREEMTKFSATELEHLPEKHAARKNPNLEILRTIMYTTPLEPLPKIINAESVLFLGKQPLFV